VSKGSATEISNSTPFFDGYAPEGKKEKERGKEDRASADALHVSLVVPVVRRSCRGKKGGEEREKKETEEE